MRQFLGDPRIASRRKAAHEASLHENSHDGLDQRVMQIARNACAFACNGKLKRPLASAQSFLGQLRLVGYIMARCLDLRGFARAKRAKPP